MRCGPCLVVLILACQDYRLSTTPRAPEQGGEPPSSQIEWPVGSGLPDPLGDPFLDPGSSGDCDSVDLPPARDWAGLPTCRAYDAFETWKMGIEQSLELSTDPETSFLSMPATLPLSGLGQRVLLQIDLASTVAVDPETGLVDLEVLRGQSGTKGVSAATDQVELSTWIGSTTALSNSTTTTAVSSTADPTLVLDSGPMSFSMDASLADLDHDGYPDFALGGGILYTGDGSILEIPSSGAVKDVVVTDLDGNGEPEVLNRSGVQWMAGEGTTAWDPAFESDSTFEAGVVQRDGAVFAVGTDVLSLFAASLDGRIQWRCDVIDDINAGWVTSSIAVGDATGDGSPDLCAFIDHTVSLTDLDGEELWATKDQLSIAGGCAMADLDADGVYEVIAWGTGGLFIYDGPTGARLAAVTDIQTWSTFNPPLIADVDGDGGAEIVVTGEWAAEEGCCHQDHLFILGPTSGRWAKTRPVWNQWGYDITSIRDDGTIVSFPFPNWQIYNSYRAQPAHDGAHPDLRIAATDACASECAAGGTIRLAVQVSNSGSVEASAGALVRLLTWTAATGLREVARATVPDAIGPDRSAAGIELSLPAEDWGDRQVLEVTGFDGDECDWLNNREEIEIPDPCG